MDNNDLGRIGDADRAGRASPEPASSLGHSATIPCAYGEPVSTLTDLETLDNDEMVEGYVDGRANEPEPSGNRSRSYWHGWRNGMADAGHLPIDGAMTVLAHQYGIR